MPIRWATGSAGLQTRFLGETDSLTRAERRIGESLTAQDAEELGLVTASWDEVDWDEEIRLVLEERASFSPDALTGLEANLRVAGPETMETQDIRPAQRVAELDLPAPERGRRRGCAETLRHRPAPPLRPGADLNAAAARGID